MSDSARSKVGRGGSPLGQAVVREMGRTRRASQRVRRRYKATLNGTLCFTIDVGRDGICVELLRALDPGTEVRGTFDAGGVEIPYRGHVRWARAGAPYLGIRAVMGVRFADEGLKR